MKKHLRNWLGLFCFALLACLWGAAPLQAAGNTVLVLPFQVTAGPEMPNAARDVPQIIGTEMQQRGLSVIPMDKARSLLSSRGGSIDMAAARELGKKAGADLVLQAERRRLCPAVPAGAGERRPGQACQLRSPLPAEPQ